MAISQLLPKLKVDCFIQMNMIMPKVVIKILQGSAVTQTVLGGLV